jgi:AcrR family transcriptional regulator
VTQSATASLRRDKKAATASQLTAASRRLTAEHGLAGWTIEEVCDDVGVSRRTFFNYFPSKDEAVLGMDEGDDGRRFAERFLARGSRGWPAVLDDVVDLAIEHMRLSGVASVDHGAEHAHLHAALNREPRLLALFMGATREREQQLAGLIAEREGVAPADPHVQALVLLVTTLLRTAGERVLSAAPEGDFATELTTSLAALREVAAPAGRAPADPSALRKDHP